LKQYADILTDFHTDSARKKAVTAILSGARATKTIAAEKLRYVGVDGRLDDLKGEINPHLMAARQRSMAGTFRWLGVGPMPMEERQKLEAIARQAKQAGVRLRFWATPESPPFWHTLREIGVDLIGTDDLAKLRTFLVTPRLSPEHHLSYSLSLLAFSAVLAVRCFFLRGFVPRVAFRQVSAVVQRNVSPTQRRSRLGIHESRLPAPYPTAVKIIAGTGAIVPLGRRSHIPPVSPTPVGVMEFLRTIIRTERKPDQQFQRRRSRNRHGSVRALHPASDLRGREKHRLSPRPASSKPDARADNIHDGVHRAHLHGSGSYPVSSRGFWLPRRRGA
jgi:hypothetical protein